MSYVCQAELDTRFGRDRGKDAMRGSKRHGAICASLLLALQSIHPAAAQSPRPIPRAPAVPNRAISPTPTNQPQPTTQPPQPTRPFSMWADILGLNSPQPSTAIPQPPQTSQPRAPTLPVSTSIRWEVLGRSAEGRVIEFAQFGEGAHQVLVIGSLDGDKPEGVAMAEFLASHLSRFPKRLTDVKVTIVRDPNPDGRARRTAVNAQGVLIDRDFNTPGWQPVKGVTGPQPESQPETRTLAELLLDVQPERVILLSTAEQRTSISFTGPDEILAKQIAIECEGQLVGNELLRQPGVLASYTGDDRGIPTIRIGFVPQSNADAIWSVHKRALLTAIGCGSPLEFMPITMKYGPRQPRQTSGVPSDGPAPSLVGAIPSADANANLPQTLSYEALRRGLPTVQIERSQIERSRIERTTKSAYDVPPTAHPSVSNPQPGEMPPSPAQPEPPPTTGAMVPIQRLTPVKQESPPKVTSAPIPIQAMPASMTRGLPTSSRMERLPPADQVTPATTKPPVMPQRPIASYPSTGL